MRSSLSVGAAQSSNVDGFMGREKDGGGILTPSQCFPPGLLTTIFLKEVHARLASLFQHSPSTQKYHVEHHFPTFSPPH